MIRELKEKVVALEQAQSEPIAVIGMACRFPGGVNDCDSFWELIVSGTSAVREIPADRWNADSFYSADREQPGKSATRYGSFLDGVDLFDTAFFDISPREAVHMDPQQRLFLEVSWQALEDAGQTKERLGGSETGVYVGVHNHSNDYHELQASDLSKLNAYTGSGTAHDVIAGRLAYWLDLRGPALAVNTACSSSLVAVDVACKSLRAKDCSMAVVGGVNLILSPATMVGASCLNMLSSDGKCKAFDASADGFGRGEGCGAVVLKRLADAMQDGDPVRAVIRGSAVNQDGRTNGLTAPNGLAQQRLMRRALQRARVEAESVGYVEAHGTGTALGDPIEVEALAEVYGRRTTESGACALGSVKANIGHLEGAAGIAGLIKSVLVLEHATIPPVANLRKLNPHFDGLDSSRLIIPAKPARWLSEGGKKLAAVSSFGWSGTNAHVILEESPVVQQRNAAPQTSNRELLLTMSAGTAKSLWQLAQQYDAALRRLSGEQVESFCFTANTRRTPHAFRLAVVGSDSISLADRIRLRIKQPSVAGFGPSSLDKVAERWEAGETIDWESFYQGRLPCLSLPAYPFDRQRYWIDLPQPVAPIAPDDWFYEIVWRQRQLPSGNSSAALLKDLVTETSIAVPALDLIADGGIEAEAGFWMHSALLQMGLPVEAGFTFNPQQWADRQGVVPQQRQLFRRMLSALVEEGVLEKRTEYFETTGKALRAPPTAAEPAIGVERAVLRNCGKSLTDVLQGRLDPLQLLFAADDGMGAERLYKDSAVMQRSHELVRRVFDRVAGRLFEDRPLRVLEIGAGTGSTTAVLLRDQTQFIREYVFTDVARTMLLKAQQQFQAVPFFRTASLDLEQDQTGGAEREAETYDVVIAANVVHATASIRKSIQNILGLLTPGGVLLLLETTKAPRWVDLVFGLTAGWWRFADHDLRPDYAILRRDQWMEVLNECFESAEAVTLPASQGNLVEQTVFLARKPALVREHKSAERKWLLFADEGGLAEKIARHVAAAGEQPVLVTQIVHPPWRGHSRLPCRDSSRHVSSRFQNHWDTQLGAPAYEFDPLDRAAHEELLNQIVSDSSGCSWKILCLWGCDASTSADEAAYAERLTASACHLLAGLSRLSAEQEGKLWIVTRDAQGKSASSASLWGLGATAALEAPGRWGGLIDLDPITRGNEAEVIVEEVSVQESKAGDVESRISYRDGIRSVARLQRYKPLARSRLALDAESAYVITGASGAVGPGIARWLVARGAKRLVLIHRAAVSGTAKANEWSALLQELNGKSVRVDEALCDIGEQAQVATLFAKFGREWPALGGVMHAAAQIDYVPLGEISSADVRSAFLTKAFGAGALIHAIEDQNPEFVVCFSSAAASLGAGGRAHYGAANAFMDALAARQNKAGCQFISVQWGAWDEQRSGSETERELIRRSGFEPMNSEMALDALETLLVSGRSRGLVARIDWSLLRPILELRREGSFLSEVELPPKPSAAATKLPENSWVNTSDLLEAQVREVFGWPEGMPIDHHRGFFEMGMDSLMSIELKNRLESLLGRSLPGTLTLNYPNISVLSEYLQPKASFESQTDGSAEASEIAELNEQETVEALRNELRLLAID